MKVKKLARKINSVNKQLMKLSFKATKLEEEAETMLANGKITTKQYNGLCDGKYIR